MHTLLVILLMIIAYVPVAAFVLTGVTEETELAWLRRTLANLGWSEGAIPNLTQAQETTLLCFGALCFGAVVGFL